MAAREGVVSLRRCTVRNCRMNGVEAVDGGSLTAEDVCSHNNMQGCLVRESAGPVQLTQVFRNGAFGLAVDAGSAARAVDCRLHGNGFWGVIVKSVSDCELQGCEIFGNKCGGVYLGLNGRGRLRLTDCWVHHNLGQGLWDTARDDKLATVVQRHAGIQAGARAMGMQTTSCKPELSATRFEGNEARHGHPPRLADWEKRCSMCQQTQGIGLQLMQCSGCRTERYFSADCQKAHWPRHRPTCKMVTAGNEVSAEVRPLEEAFRGAGGSRDKVAAMLPHPLLKVKKNAKTAAERGGNIIVKLQTHENDVDPNQWLVVYDPLAPSVAASARQHSSTSSQTRACWALTASPPKRCMFTHEWTRGASGCAC
ncbi:Small glutamine-rich tetratricopeptide repeat-containing beta [Micractinium conductrix]|uniref:Small glutamine-rich tetratricopeptide repeat-containing beta n=1 Tax=Micractinium conductrix TaxID=554055 RepID=A0A2P6V3W2_9CHLO|nr:Small glutamine-rich tetratricopeptide repeat-containing beta [Micractinium conductrix]|eukprot:PSC68776.1 Small glutamine-rich tetratricopeptide repeat-containing beta [Micractinium conductrix]